MYVSTSIPPILIFLGIPPVYAVANGANNILAASVSGSLARYFKNQIDVKMGILILIGGLVGAILGVEIFTYFIKEGSIHNLISISYFVLLSSIGILMFYESLSEMRRISNNKFTFFSLKITISDIYSYSLLSFSL